MQFEKYHILGLGGIGMSACARLLKQMGLWVSGSDRCSSELIDQLKKEGVEVGSTISDQADCVVYSSAIAKTHPDLLKAREKNLPIFHRAELLTQLMQNKETILIAGTHGKTSVSALLAYVLMQAELSPTFYIGGILKNYQSNACLGNGKFFVAEADESDGSFLKHPCSYAIITNLEKDHLDYWKNEKKLIEAFTHFCKNVSQRVLWCRDDKNLQRISPIGISYGFSNQADIRVHDCKVSAKGTTFSVVYKQKVYKEIFIPTFGKHQILNAACVFGFAILQHIPLKCIRKAFQSFQGVKRRADLIGTHRSVDIYHDYAHHPTEVRATLVSFRQKVEERRLTVIFQPHRYSRIQTLFGDFRKCFQLADQLIITEIFSAGEKKVFGLSEKFFKEISHANKTFVQTKELDEHLLKETRLHDVVLFLGAGDIYRNARSFYEKYRRTKKRLKVGILYGGCPSEHEVSISSSKFFFENIDKTLYEVMDFPISGDCLLTKNLLEKMISCDVCIPVLHGRRGEDGMIQGFLESFKIPYVGCNYGSCALSMNKSWTKAIAQKEGIPTPPYMTISHRRWKMEPEKVMEDLKNFCTTSYYVKGCHMGSSIGIKRCEDFSKMKKTLEYVFTFDDELIVEQEVKGKQIEFALWGNDFIHIGEPTEIGWNHFYSYHEKYRKNLCLVPANVEKVILEKGKEMAINIYKACSCTGLARIDFFLNEKNEFYLNEINPMPGFTPTSAYFPMLEYIGISKKEFIHKLIILALHQAYSHA